jgi:hypothetical protein
MDISKALDKSFANKTFKELVDCPITALQGLSVGDAINLRDTFNVKTIKDLATLKYVRWAQEIVTLSEVE